MTVMTQKQQLEEALTAAIRSGNDVDKRTLRMALSAIRLAEVDKGAALDDAGVTAILQKEVKMREEAIAEARQANRPDLEAASQDEIGVLQGFLPAQLTEPELEALARAAIAETGASSAQQMGQVMKILMPQLQGRATGNQASQVVRRLLG
jgi:uncharacterized protein YqeY